MKEEFVFLNGEYLSCDSAKISVFDRGFLYGDALFETLRSHSKKPFMLKEHLERLFLSLLKIRIRPIWSHEEIAQYIDELHKLNDLANAYIRITVTRGVSKEGLFVKGDFEPTILITAKEFDGYPKHLYEGGMGIEILEAPRSTSSPCATVKSTNLLHAITSRFDLRSDIDEVIFMCPSGIILEGSISNIFLVKGDTISTPRPGMGILDGITRGAIMKLAENNGIKVKEKDIDLIELTSSSESFLTNSLMGVMPISRLFIKSDLIHRFLLPGPITTRLSTLYRDLTLRCD